MNRFFGACSVLAAWGGVGLAALLSWGCREDPTGSAGHARVMAQGRTKGGYKGYDEVDRWFRQSIAAPSPGAGLEQFLPAGMEARSARQLMGAFDPDANGGSGAFVNGSPGVVSVFLWDRVAVNLARWLEQGCDLAESGEDSSPFRAGFFTDLKKLCTARTAESFSAVWWWVVGFEADEERQAVLAEWGNDLPDLSVSEVTYAMIMNPSFLLEN